jgi:hypothetical protein
MMAYNKPDETTNVLLHKLKRLGLIRKVGRGPYTKNPAQLR